MKLRNTEFVNIFMWLKSTVSNDLILPTSVHKIATRIVLFYKIIQVTIRRIYKTISGNVVNFYSVCVVLCKLIGHNVVLLYWMHLVDFSDKCTSLKIMFLESQLHSVVCRITNWSFSSETDKSVLTDKILWI